MKCIPAQTSSEIWAGFDLTRKKSYNKEYNDQFLIALISNQFLIPNV